MTAAISTIHISPEVAEPRQEHRWHRALQRHWLVLLTLLSLVSSGLLLAGTALPRRYGVGATFALTARDGADEGAELLGTAGAALVAELRTALRAGGSPLADRVEIQVSTREQGRHVTLTASTPERDRTLALLHETVLRYTRARNAQTDDLLTALRNAAARALTLASAERRAAGDALDTFRIAHPELTGEAPAARLEKLSATAEERQRRLGIVNELISRLEQHKARMRGERPAAPKPGPAAVPLDPEVMQLKAQLALLNEQIDEQLNQLRRTEQHPYVVDLRVRQEGLQRKLAAATARAAAGKPPPEDVKPVPAEKDSGTTMALQALELQLAQAYAERDSLEPEIQRLKVEREALRKQAEALAPAQQQFARLEARQRQAVQAHEAARARYERLENAYSAARPLEISAPVFSGQDARPLAPTFAGISAGALSVGLLCGLAGVYLAERLGRGYRSPREFHASTNAPVLGVVSAIHTPAQHQLRRAWRQIGRPLAVLALLALLAGSAALGYAGLGRTGGETIRGMKGSMHGQHL